MNKQINILTQIKKNKAHILKMFTKTVMCAAISQTRKLMNHYMVLFSPMLVQDVGKRVNEK
jgi:hypothetical protein